MKGSGNPCGARRQHRVAPITTAPPSTCTPGPCCCTAQQATHEDILFFYRRHRTVMKPEILLRMRLEGVWATSSTTRLLVWKSMPSLE